MMRIATLLLCGLSALAESDAAPASAQTPTAEELVEGYFAVLFGLETNINCQNAEGSCVIQVDAGEDLGWIADDMSQDDSVVELAYADNLGGTFVARYDPVGDGDVIVCLRHFTGIVCDEAHTFDLHVENSAVTECTGGSHIASPDETEQTPYLSGEWLEREIQFSQMTVSRNVDRGWDVEIASPLSHGAYVFKTTVYYDCGQAGSGDRV